MLDTQKAALICHAASIAISLSPWSLPRMHNDTSTRTSRAVSIRPLRAASPPRRPGNNGNRRDEDGEGKTGLLTKVRPKTKKPSLYKVLLLNDDYTPMEFVVHVLERFFNKRSEEATNIMLHVHQKGVGVCGVYTYEVAETKVTQVMDFSRQHGHPLQCTMEKE
jgi:ATP-dependent Clp protease adaptor protein ClpS